MRPDTRSPARLPTWSLALLAVALPAACGSRGASSTADAGAGPDASLDSSSMTDSGSSTADAPGDTSSGSSSGGSSCDGGPCNTVPAGLLDPAYTTTWNPGIL